jgi:hypothetical protein
MSSKESIAEESTAIDPVNHPVTSFSTVKPVAVIMEMCAARILGFLGIFIGGLNSVRGCFMAGAGRDREKRLAAGVFFGF